MLRFRAVTTLRFLLNVPLNSVTLSSDMIAVT